MILYLLGFICGTLAQIFYVREDKIAFVLTCTIGAIMAIILQ